MDNKPLIESISREIDTLERYVILRGKLQDTITRYEKLVLKVKDELEQETSENVQIRYKERIRSFESVIKELKDLLK